VAELTVDPNEMPDEIQQAELKEQKKNEGKAIVGRMAFIAANEAGMSLSFEDLECVLEYVWSIHNAGTIDVGPYESKIKTLSNEVEALDNVKNDLNVQLSNYKNRENAFDVKLNAERNLTIDARNELARTKIKLERTRGALAQMVDVMATLADL
jgi:hypothetical protein